MGQRNRMYGFTQLHARHKSCGITRKSISVYPKQLATSGNSYLFVSCNQQRNARLMDLSSILVNVKKLDQRNTKYGLCSLECQVT